MSKSKKRALRIASAAASQCNFGDKVLAQVQGAALGCETREQRVKRLFVTGGGPLMGWLLDECRIRGLAVQALAVELGVTYGYINQLRNGIREVTQVGPRFAQRAARFLGVPTVVVKLIAGQLTMSDFIPPQQSEEEFVERALCRMMEDPKAGMFVSLDILAAELAVKKDFLSLYAEVSGDDIYNMKELPDMLRWLQRATFEHSENVLAAERGQEGKSALALAA